MMPTCAKCGNPFEKGQRFCRTCGEKLEGAAQTGAAPRSASTDNDLALFVGKNTEKYLSRFDSFQHSGDSFEVTWHWPAFFVPFWWLLYRKMYLWAVLVFSLLPFVRLILMVVFGMSAHYLYYRRAKTKVAEVRSEGGTDVEIAAALARAGGVNNVAVVVAPLLAVFIIAILAAIAIPQFAMYRQKAGDMQAKQQALEACRIGADLFAGQPDRPAVEPEELLAGGLVHTEDVELLLLDNSRQGFRIGARHRHGRKSFYTDRDCALNEDTAPLPQAPGPR